jgi:hypothetical protein
MMLKGASCSAMNLRGKTSRLLELQRTAGEELHARFADIFKKYRALAFVGRHDQLFKEHWTPEMAAAGYQFSGYEAQAGRIVLHGTEFAGGFAYRISIDFPVELLDRPAAIKRHFERKYAEGMKDPKDDTVGPARTEKPAASE